MAAEHFPAKPSLPGNDDKKLDRGDRQDIERGNDGRHIRPQQAGEDMVHAVKQEQKSQDERGVVEQQSSSGEWF